MASFYEDNTGGLTAESYHHDERLMVLKTQYSAGIDYGEVQETSFGTGEGWTGNQIVLNQSVDYSFTNISKGSTFRRASRC